MIQANAFIEKAKKAGFDFYTGVPCSYLKPFINFVIDSKELTYVGATNEGDAVAIAAGATLAGHRSVVLFQNSGFGNTVNPLTSLNAIFKIPSLIITTWRGEPGGAADEPQHELMGQITPELFDLMKIKWEFFPVQESDIDLVLERALSHMQKTQEPYGIIMKKDSVSDYKLTTKLSKKSLSSQSLNSLKPASWPQELPTRKQVLNVIQKASAPKDSIFATTGFTGRALYAIEDRPNQLYMVGSMGCVASFGLGYALARGPDAARTLVLDGDGAALMRMGALATIGYERPKNFIHFILDNEVHDSTGGQSTVSHSIDFGLIALGCGYPRVVQTSDLGEIEALVKAPTPELTLVHVKTAPGESKDLPRPTVTPRQVYLRFQEWQNK